MDNQQNCQREGKAICDGVGGGSGGGGGGDGGQNSNHPPPRPCPRCHSNKTKFCYYNNYSLSQPRYFCKGCRRYWTQGGTLRNVPVGGGCRKSKRPRVVCPSTSAPPPPPPMLPENYHLHQMQVTAALGGASGSGSGGGNMLFGLRESTSAGFFMPSLAAMHQQGGMSQQPPLNYGPDLSFMHGFTMPGYPPNNPDNQLFQNVYTMREVGSSSASSAAAMTADWNLSIQPGAPPPPPSLSEPNNDDDDNNNDQSSRWADYMGNSGLGGEP